MRTSIDVPPPSFSSGFAFRFTRGDMDNHRRVVLSDPVYEEHDDVVVVNFFGLMARVGIRGFARAAIYSDPEADIASSRRG